MPSRNAPASQEEAYATGRCGIRVTILKPAICEGARAALNCDAATAIGTAALDANSFEPQLGCPLGSDAAAKVGEEWAPTLVEHLAVAHGHVLRGQDAALPLHEDAPAVFAIGNSICKVLRRAGARKRE